MLSSKPGFLFPFADGREVISFLRDGKCHVRGEKLSGRGKDGIERKKAPIFAFDTFVVWVAVW